MKCNYLGHTEFACDKESIYFYFLSNANDGYFSRCDEHKVIFSDDMELTELSREDYLLRQVFES